MGRGRTLTLATLDCHCLWLQVKNPKTAEIHTPETLNPRTLKSIGSIGFRVWGLGFRICTCIKTETRKS